MQEGYRFLDEKRMLLAAEMVHQLRRFEALMAHFHEHYEQAREALRRAAARHGLDGLQCYPASPAADTELGLSQRALLGVPLLDAEMNLVRPEVPAGPHPSPEAEACREAFARVLLDSATLAALSSNLNRLLQEYRRTERRARALEDVLLPEIAQTLQELETRLEEGELEEATRVRLVGRRD